MRRLLAILATVLFCASLTTAPASAGTVNGGDVLRGYFADESYRGEHYLFVEWWNYVNRDPDDRMNQVFITVDAGDLAAGNCVQAAFDWRNGGGHYDPRIVRVCKDFGHRATSFPWYTEPNVCAPGGTYCALWMHQVQFAIYDVSTGKLSHPECISEDEMGGFNVDRVCDGPNWDADGDHETDWTPDPNNTCAGQTAFRIWIRRSDGSTDLCEGGAPYDDESKHKNSKHTPLSGR